MTAPHWCRPVTGVGEGEGDGLGDGEGDGDGLGDGSIAWKEVSAAGTRSKNKKGKTIRQTAENKTRVRGR